jgi:hypothetical protein
MDGARFLLPLFSDKICVPEKHGIRDIFSMRVFFKLWSEWPPHATARNGRWSMRGYKFKGCCPGNFTSELSRHSRNQDRVGGRFLPTKSKTAHCSPQHKLADSHIHVPHWARGSAWRLWRQQRANRCATTNERKTSLARQGRTPRRRRRRPCRLRTRRPMVARTDTHDTLNLENI